MIQERLSGRRIGSDLDRGTPSTIDKLEPRRKPLYRLMSCGVFLIAAIAIGTAVMVGVFRERALDSARRELENTVLLLADHFDQELKDFEIPEKDMVAQIQSARIASPDLFRDKVSTLEMHEALRARMSGYDDVAGINIFDSEGVLINSSEMWPVPAIKVDDRAYFKAFKTGASSTPTLIELLPSRLSSGAWAIIVSRKVTGPRGEFLGFVSRGIKSAHIEEFFASMVLAKDAAISMHHRDGTLLARYPHVEAMIGKNFKTGPADQQRPFAEDHTTLQTTSPIDDQERLISARSLTGFPIVIVATTTVATALADWRGQTRLMIAAAALTTLVVVIMLLLIVRQHQSSQRSLAMEKQRLDTAVNNMTQGLLLFDSSQRLVVCNQRFIEIYGLSPEVVKPGCSIRDIAAHGQEIGLFDGDVDKYCSGVLRDAALRTISVAQTADGRWIQMAHQPLKDGGWVTTVEDITERRQSEERIEHLAHYDALTDLPNRVLFRELLQRRLERMRRGEQLAVLYLDLDEFKSINDTLGHAVGDELLKAVASRMRGCLRETDLVARLGGDEFAIIQTVCNRTDVTNLITRLFEAVRAPYECFGHQVSTDTSVGIALVPEHGTDLDHLLRNADLAMYVAKADGRRTYRFFEPVMETRLMARRTLEQDLRQAISGGCAAGGFELYYQPVVCLRDDEITGCEALLRWRHPKRGMISPAEFIPIAEESGLIEPLGEWILSTACAEAARWPGNRRLAVNVSPVQFRNHTLPLKVAAALATSGLPPSRLELEITEAVLIRDDEAALIILHQLHAIGVRIALDDFGTGYSSLSYLHRFPFDKIKIDRCFVSNIVESEGSKSIVQAVINIADARNITTTAEGVETELQREVLHALGCTEMQGYLFSPAKPAAEMRKVLDAHYQNRQGRLAG